MERLLGKRPFEDAIANEEPFIPDTILNPNA
jgi:hypothetical protein